MKCHPKSKSGSKGPGVHDYEDLDLNRDGRKDKTTEGLRTSREGGFHPEFVMRPFLKLADGRFYELESPPDDLRPSLPSSKVYAFTEPGVETRFFEGRIYGREKGLMSYGVGQCVGVFDGTKPAVISTMTISGLTIEFDREVLLPGVARFCATLDGLWNINHKAYEQKGENVTQVHDTTSLSWIVGGPGKGLPVERFNIDMAINKVCKDRYLSASELLIRPLLQQLDQEAQAVKDGALPCLTEKELLIRLNDALKQWHKDAKAEDPVRAKLIWNDSHLKEGLRRACMIIAGVKS